MSKRTLLEAIEQYVEAQICKVQTENAFHELNRRKAIQNLAEKRQVLEDELGKIEYNRDYLI